MKKALILSLLFASNVFANTDAQHYSQFEELAERKQYEQLLATINNSAALNDPKLQYFKIAALANLPDKLENADELVEQAIEKHPNNHELHRLASAIKFSLAQQASIFSAPGLAKDGLALLERAYKLAPDDKKVLSSLIGFYSNAPGIVGGDEEKAIALAKEWQQHAPLLGGLALVDALIKDDQQSQADALFNQLKQDYPLSHQINAKLAREAAEDKDYALSVKHLNLAIKQSDKDTEKHEYLYQLGRLTAEHKLDATSGIKAIEQYLAFYQGSQNQKLVWAKARLAKIYANNKEVEKAKSLITEIQPVAKDDKQLKKELKRINKLL